MKRYVEAPSDNFAERERQIPFYSPALCFKYGQTHKAYGWAPIPLGGWDEGQTSSYMEAFRE